MTSFPYTTDVTKIPGLIIKSIKGCNRQSPRYQCPDQCWSAHHTAWVKELRKGNELAPEPMPYGHCMFKNPTSYACVPIDNQDAGVLRAAILADVRGLLVDGGWTRDMEPDQVDRIINVTVDARMSGQDVGMFPFLACLSSTI